MCNVAQRCLNGADCASSSCSSVRSVCLTEDPALLCQNTVQDGTEADVDCGGTICRAAGSLCKTLPLPRVPTALVAKTLPLPCVFPLPLWLRHCLCFVCFYCLRG